MKVFAGFFLAISLFLIPLWSYAALNAGVINGVWFSNPTPEEGEIVRIFTAVQNSSDETVEGTVAFLVNGDIAGTAPFVAKSNEIIQVSIEYTFEDGAHDVSSYITSSGDDRVVYTVVPDTSVSVSRKAPVVEKESAATLKNATTTLGKTAETVSETGKNVVKKINPAAESAAVRVETFRDSFLVPQNASTTATESTSIETPSEEVPEETGAARHFLNDSKTIATSEEIPVWKKAVGILLSFLALLLRFWFIFLVLLLSYVFWRLIRGRRIR